jgi:hypothetical protein
MSQTATRKHPLNQRDIEMFNAGVDACVDLLSTNETLADAANMLCGLKANKSLPMTPYRVAGVVAELMGQSVASLLRNTQAPLPKYLTWYILNKHMHMGSPGLAELYGTSEGRVMTGLRAMRNLIWRSAKWRKLAKRAEQVLGVYLD